MRNSEKEKHRFTVQKGKGNTKLNKKVKIEVKLYHIILLTAQR